MSAHYVLPTTRTPSKNHTKRRIILTLLVLLIIGAGAIYLFKPSSSKVVTSTVPSQPRPTGPNVTFTTITKTQSLPYGTTTVKSTSLPTGTSKVTTPGVAGIATLTYHIPVTNGKQGSKQLINIVTTKKPTDEIITTGTGPAAPVATPTPTPVQPVTPPPSTCVPSTTITCP